MGLRSHAHGAGRHAQGRGSRCRDSYAIHMGSDALYRDEFKMHKDRDVRHRDKRCHALEPGMSCIGVKASCTS